MTKRREAIEQQVTTVSKIVENEQSTGTQPHSVQRKLPDEHSISNEIDGLIRG
jgi:hypothetical protein